MWIFTSKGFYSAVADRNSPADIIVVRGRQKKHLEAFVQGVREMGLPKSIIPQIEHTPKADYPWRTHVTRELWATFVKHEAEAITYPNFKNAALNEKGNWVEPVKGRQPINTFYNALHRVWEAMRGAEDAGARVGR